MPTQAWDMPPGMASDRDERRHPSRSARPDGLNPGALLSEAMRLFRGSTLVARAGADGACGQHRDAMVRSAQEPARRAVRTA